MPRKTNALSATTKANKILKLKKHIKKFTRLKPVTRQVNGRLVITSEMVYVGCEDAVVKLKRLESI